MKIPIIMEARKIIAKITSNKSFILLKNNISKYNLLILVVATIIYNVLIILYLKGDPSAKFKFWLCVGLFYVIFLVIFISSSYRDKLNRRIRRHDLTFTNEDAQKKINTCNKILIGFLLSFLIIWLWVFLNISVSDLGSGLISLISAIKKNDYDLFKQFVLNINYINLFIVISLAVLFLLPLILMLIDAFRIKPLDDSLLYLNKFFRNLFNYTPESISEKSTSVNENEFLNQKDSGEFVIERFFRVDNNKFKLKLNPIFKVIIAVILTYYFWYNTFGVDKIMRSETWWGLFGIYLVILLINYRERYIKLSSEIKESLNIPLEHKKIYDTFIRRSAYIFWYSYFVYFIFLVPILELGGDNLVDFFLSKLSQSSYNKDGLIIFLTFLTYLSSWALIALPMVGDGFGIVPVLSNLSKDLSSKMYKKFNLYHPDKSAGFRPLGEFCFKMSLFISLPFIIGMPIQLIRYPLNNQGIISYIMDNGFNMAFIGVGIAGAAIFIFCVRDINKKIEKEKMEKLKILMDKYTTEVENCTSDKLSPMLICIDSKIKKINNIEMAPYGRSLVIRFYSTLLIPTFILLLNIIKL